MKKDVNNIDDTQKDIHICIFILLLFCIIFQTYMNLTLYFNLLHNLFLIHIHL